MRVVVETGRPFSAFYSEDGSLTAERTERVTSRERPCQGERAKPCENDGLGCACAVER